MSTFQAKKGESKDCVVIQAVLSLWWTRRRVHPGETVKLGALVKDVKDGAAITFEIRLAAAKPASDPLKTLDGKIDGGQCQLDWKVELPERDDWPPEVPLVFDVTVGGKLKSSPTVRRVMDVEAGLPPFSL